MKERRKQMNERNKKEQNKGIKKETETNKEIKRKEKPRYKERKGAK